MSRLKPCPLCGEEVKLVHGGISGICWIVHDDRRKCGICFDLGGRPSVKNERRMLIRLWNRRPNEKKA